MHNFARMCTWGYRGNAKSLLIEMYSFISDGHIHEWYSSCISFTFSLKMSKFKINQVCTTLFGVTHLVDSSWKRAFLIKMFQPGVKIKIWQFLHVEIWMRLVDGMSTIGWRKLKLVRCSGSGSGLSSYREAASLGEKFRGSAIATLQRVVAGPLGVNEHYFG